jgi:hypothetical protein
LALFLTQAAIVFAQEDAAEAPDKHSGGRLLALYVPNIDCLTFWVCTGKNSAVDDPVHAGGHRIILSDITIVLRLTFCLCQIPSIQ